MSQMSYRSAAASEKELGMEFFYTGEDGIGGRLRSTPEDFIVEEISETPKPDDEGQYTAVIIKSTNWETNRLIRQLARALRISRKRVMFVGTKDKRAVTTQLFVIQAPLDDVKDMRIIDVEVLKAHSTSKKLYIGNLFGNSFSIIVRELAAEQSTVLETCEKISSRIEELGGFPNYFGIQRFGAVRPITHLVGKHMIMGEPELAVKEFLCTTGELEGEAATKARLEFTDSWDIARALIDFPKILSFEKVLLNHLLKHPEDYKGALSQLPRNLLTMFVHAYQSYIFNKILSRRMADGLELNEPVIGDLVLKLDRNGLPAHDNWVKAEARNITKLKELAKSKKAFVSAPLFGYESEFAEGEAGEIEQLAIEEEGVRKRDYLLPEFRELDLKGTRREILAPIKSISYEPSNHESIKFEFELNKGCYATTLLREFMTSGDLCKY
jgi:tRNA pseudouridine13 synthase